MFVLSRSQKLFDEGVAALGFPVRGRRRRPDLAEARTCFEQALAIDPQMCDAWLGLAATGRVDHQVIAGLFRTANYSLYRDQRRLGMQPGTLHGYFDTRLAVNARLAHGSDIWAAAAVVHMETERYGDALAILDSLSPDTELSAFIRGGVHFNAERWPDVLASLRDHENWADSPMRLTARFLVGRACAHLGLFEEARRRLTQVAEGSAEDLAKFALHFLGLIAREEGDEGRARRHFERVYVTDPGYAANADAMRSQHYRLGCTTAERIAARTDPWDPRTEPADGTSSAEQQARSEQQARRADVTAEAQRRLDAMIGLDSVKREVRKLTAASLLAQVHTDGTAPTARSRHLVFTGPPGVGKTEVARIIARIYYGLGILATDKVVEVAPNDFFARGSGSPEQLSREIFDSAIDGVLFIDEAYSLYHDGWIGGDAAGGKVIDGLLATMENNRDRLVVIVAGYEDAMNTFLDRNDGLKSRFARQIRFPSYRPADLVAIAGTMATETYRAELTESAARVVLRVAEYLSTESEDTADGRTRTLIDREGNARFARNLIEAAIEERDVRIVSTHDNLGSLTDEVRARIEPDDVRLAVADRFPHIADATAPDTVH